MKKLILLLFILLLLPFICNAGMIIQTVASGGSGTTVYIGTTTCGGQACDYSGSSAFYFDINDPDVNRSGATEIPVDGCNTSGAGGGEGWGLVYLDLTAFNAAVGGAGAVTITDVTLYLHTVGVDNSPIMSVTFHNMLTLTGGASFDDTNATWNERDASGDVQWDGNTNLLYFGDDVDYASSALVTLSTDDMAADTWETVSSSTLTALVDDWHEGTVSNYGILVIGNQEFSKYTFHSDSYVTANLRLYWGITYE